MQITVWSIRVAKWDGKVAMRFYHWGFYVSISVLSVLGVSLLTKSIRAVHMYYYYKDFITIDKTDVWHKWPFKQLLLVHTQ